MLSHQFVMTIFVFVYNSKPIISAGWCCVRQQIRILDIYRKGIRINQQSLPQRIGTKGTRLSILDLNKMTIHYLFQELVKSGLKQPEGIAIDWYTDNIYFTESEISHIGVCTNDGQHCTVLISKNVQKPRGIVLNPNKG